MNYKYDDEDFEWTHQEIIETFLDDSRCFGWYHDMWSDMLETIPADEWAFFFGRLAVDEVFILDTIGIAHENNVKIPKKYKDKCWKEVVAYEHVERLKRGGISFDDMFA